LAITVAGERSPGAAGKVDGAPLRQLGVQAMRFLNVETPQRVDRKRLRVRGGAEVVEGVTDELVTVHGGSLGAPTV
jgi:hypothetical protein